MQQPCSREGIKKALICKSEQPVNRGQAYTQLVADFALAVAFGGEGGYFIGQLVAVGSGSGEQVVTFGAVAFECEVQKRAGFLDAAQAYIIVAVTLAGIALLYLFEVAKVGADGAFSDGEGAVGKVDKQFAAVQIIGADGLCGVAPFGGMRQYEDGEVVVGF